ncbi:MAG: hypothetical protein Q8J78_15075 [Moraxellaceae bacterium]|nr:hypothetical protein [Moraxellaceae bacterium]
MSVTRSRLRAHAIEWHVAPPPDTDATHREHFLELQRRCNAELCRHSALVRNVWLDALEQGRPAPEALQASMGQLAIMLRQLVLAREGHTLELSHHAEPPDSVRLPLQGSAAVVVCFDAAGVPWCPPLPGMGMGDPYVLSEQLYSWWSGWRQQFPALAQQDWGLRAAWPETRALCALIDCGYNADAGAAGARPESSEAGDGSGGLSRHADGNASGDSDGAAHGLATALGTMLALENSLSTDLWQRLGRSLAQHGERIGAMLPDAGFFAIAETHARLQARHGLYLLEAASLGDQLDEPVFFRAGLHVLDHLERFWTALAEAVQPRH